MAFGRRLVRSAAIFVPLSMFVAVPLFGIWSSHFFGLYIVAYVVIAAALALLKWKVDGTFWW